MPQSAKVLLEPDQLLSKLAQAGCFNASVGKSSIGTQVDSVKEKYEQVVSMPQSAKVLLELILLVSHASFSARFNASVGKSSIGTFFVRVQ